MRDIDILYYVSHFILLFEGGENVDERVREKDRLGKHLPQGLGTKEKTCGHLSKLFT